MFAQVLKKVLNGEPIPPQDYSYKLQAHTNSFKLLLVCDNCKLEFITTIPTNVFSQWKLKFVPRLLKNDNAESILNNRLCVKCNGSTKAFPDLYDPRDVEEADAESRTIDE